MSSGLKIFGNRKPQGVETWGFYTTLHSREEWNKGLLLISTMPEYGETDIYQ